MLDEIRQLAAGEGGLSASWATVIAVGTLLLGTGSTTIVAIINWIQNRGKNKGDAAKSIIEAASSLVTPFNLALEAANREIKRLQELDEQKTRELANARLRQRRSEQRIENLEAEVDDYKADLGVCKRKLAAYEAKHGPLTTYPG